MLGAGGDAGTLDATDVGSGQFARQIGVFGEIFEIAAAQGAALDVQTGSQQHIHIIGGGLLAQILTQFLAQLHVPTVGHGGGGGEAGSGDGFVHTQIVGGTCLLAQTVGTVGEENGRDAETGDFPRGPRGFALQQSGFFFRCQIVDELLNIHGRLLYIIRIREAGLDPPLQNSAGNDAVLYYTIFLREMGNKKLPLYRTTAVFLTIRRF